MEVRVFAPATIANVGVGYDLLGFAIEQPGDEVVARKTDRPGVVISDITGCAEKLPSDPEKNTAGAAVLSLLEHLQTDSGIELEIHKKMPFGSGLGSSAASAAAAVYAANLVLDEPLSKVALAPFAIKGESVADGAIHGDNVLPSLLGGMVLIRDSVSPDFTQLPVNESLVAMVVYPELQILTREARSILSAEVSLTKHIKQSGNLASLVAGLYDSDLDRIARSLQDHIIEPQRAALIPNFYSMQEIAMQCGALNYTISGAGPSMFGFFRDDVAAKSAADQIKKFLGNKDIGATSYISFINQKGACLV